MEHYGIMELLYDGGYIMHTIRNKIIFYGSTLAAGLCSLGLHRYMMDNCFDAKGLMIAGNLPGRLLVLVGAVFAGVLLLMLRSLGGNGEYADNFPRDPASGLLMTAAGLLLAAAIPSLAQPPAPAGTMAAWVTLFEQFTDICMTALPWLAAASMVVLGLCRMLGKRPSPWFGGIVCLFYMLMLVTNYRLWSADPQLQDYAYQLLSGVMLMLCAFHRTCCDAGVIQRRKLIFTGLAAAFCATAALSMEFIRLFYLASALWALGCICSVEELPRDEEDAPEDAPEAAPAEE